MIVALLALVILQPFSFQKERAANSLLEHLGNEYLTPSSKRFLAEAICDAEPKTTDFPYTPVLCSYETSCGIEMERIVWHQTFYGAFTSAEPISWNIAETCPKMLKQSVRESVLERIRQGG